MKVLGLRAYGGLRACRVVRVEGFVRLLVGFYSSWFDMFFRGFRVYRIAWVFRVYRFVRVHGVYRACRVPADALNPTP